MALSSSCQLPLGSSQMPLQRYKTLFNRVITV